MISIFMFVCFVIGATVVIKFGGKVVSIALKEMKK